MGPRVLRALGRAVCELADRQHGIVTRGQLLSLGFSPEQIRQRVRAGWLQEIHAGVYAVGRTRLTDHGRWYAAAAACGDDGLVSHGSGVALWRLVAPILGPVHVTVPHHTARRCDGLIVHRTRRHEDLGRQLQAGIPVTGLARTLLDFAGVASPGRLRSAVQAADRHRWFDLRECLVLCESARGVRGAARLRILLAHYRPLPETRSPTEDHYLRLCDRAGIPRPATNVPIGDREVDCYWPDAGVVVELDAYGTHGDPWTFESDRKRDNAFQIAGLIALRFTRERVLGEPEAVIAETLAGLEAGRRAGNARSAKPRPAAP